MIVFLCKIRLAMATAWLLRQNCNWTPVIRRNEKTIWTVFITSMTGKAWRPMQ